MSSDANHSSAVKSIAPGEVSVKVRKLKRLSEIVGNKDLGKSAACGRFLLLKYGIFAPLLIN